MKGLKDKLYIIGACISFLAITGVAESITGHGDINISIIILIVGFVLCLIGYV